MLLLWLKTARLGFLTETNCEKVKLTVPFDMEKLGSWTSLTTTLRGLALKTLNKIVSTKIMRKIRKIVVTNNISVQPDGGLRDLLVDR